MPSLVPSRPFTFRSVVMSILASELDLDVDASGQVQPHQRVNGLGSRVDDVDQPLVRAHLEVLAAVLVLVGRPDHAVDVLLGRQRDRAGHLGAGARHRVDDLAGRGVDHLVVIGLEPDADLLSRHRRPHFSSYVRLSALVSPTPALGRVAPRKRTPGGRVCWVVVELAAGRCRTYGTSRCGAPPGVSWAAQPRRPRQSNRSILSDPPIQIKSPGHVPVPPRTRYRPGGGPWRSVAPNPANSGDSQRSLHHRAK